MYTKLVRLRPVALEDVLEFRNVDVVQQGCSQVRVGVVVLREPRVYVPHQTPRVVFEGAVDVVGVRQVEGTKMNGIIAEWSTVHTPATRTRWVCDVLLREPGVGAIWDEFAVAAHAVRISGEQGAVLRSLRVNGPIPVREYARVAAEALQILLPEMDERPMPGEEVRRVVDVHGVVYMSCYILIMSGLYTRVIWCLCSRHMRRRQSGETSHSVREAFPRSLIHCAPFLPLLGGVESAVGCVATALTNDVAVGEVVLHILQRHAGNIVKGEAARDLIVREVPCLRSLSAGNAYLGRNEGGCGQGGEYGGAHPCDSIEVKVKGARERTNGQYGL